jgi:hypothetical protein
MQPPEVRLPPLAAAFRTRCPVRLLLGTDMSSPKKYPPTRDYAKATPDNRRSGRLREDDHVPTAEHIAGRSERACQRPTGDGCSLVPNGCASSAAVRSGVGVSLSAAGIRLELVAIACRNKATDSSFVDLIYRITNTGS